MRFASIHAEKANYPVRLLCRTLLVSSSGYYSWSHRRPCNRRQADASLGIKIAISHRRSGGTYGSPRVFKDLKGEGLPVGRKRVERLMRQQGLRSVRKRRFRATTNSRHDLPVKRNVLARAFSVDRPNAAWVGDITYVWTAEGWLYLAVLLDLFSRRVVGWSVRDTLETSLALEALERAIRTRQPPSGWLHHTDRGVQYCSHEYQSRLEASGATGSMSRVGNCWDNAVAESFFATLKGDIRDFDRFPSREAAIATIGSYIDGFYNVQRRHSSIGYLSPVEFELRSSSVRSAA